MPERVVIRTGQTWGVEGWFQWHTKSWKLNPLPFWTCFEAEGSLWSLTPWPGFENLYVQAYKFSEQGLGDIVIEVEPSADFSGSVLWQGKPWRVISRGTAVVVLNADSLEQARFTPAWRDSELALGATHRLNFTEGLPGVIAALAFGVCIGTLSAPSDCS